MQSVARLPVHEFPVVGPGGTVFSSAFIGHGICDHRISSRYLVPRVKPETSCQLLRSTGDSRWRHGLRVNSTPARTVLFVLKGCGTDSSPANCQLSHIRIRQSVCSAGMKSKNAVDVGGRNSRPWRATGHSGGIDDLGDLVEEVALQREDDDRWMRRTGLAAAMAPTVTGCFGKTSSVIWQRRSPGHWAPGKMLMQPMISRCLCGV